MNKPQTSWSDYLKEHGEVETIDIIQSCIDAERHLAAAVELAGDKWCLWWLKQKNSRAIRDVTGSV